MLGLQRFVFQILLLTLALVLDNCGIRGPGNGSNSSQLYTYNFFDEEFQCHTNEHFFETREELCRCLQDEAFNNYCARGKRESEFQIICSGEYRAVGNCQESI